MVDPKALSVKASEMAEKAAKKDGVSQEDNKYTDYLTDALMEISNEVSYEDGLAYMIEHPKALKFTIDERTIDPNSTTVAELVQEVMYMAIVYEGANS